MRTLLIIGIALGSASFQAASAFDFTLGAGLDSHVTRGVNAATERMVEAATYFARLELGRWGLQPEMTWTAQSTSAGALSVSRQTWASALWGRYSILDPKPWSPFLSLGVGLNEDRIKSVYASESVSHRGHRAQVGVGAGLGWIFVDHLMLDGELRLLVIEDQRDPDFDFVVRAGFRF